MKFPVLSIPQVNKDLLFMPYPATSSFIILLLVILAMTFGVYILYPYI